MARKKLIVLLVAVLVAVVASASLAYVFWPRGKATESTGAKKQSGSEPSGDGPQIGLNFIRVFWGEDGQKGNEKASADVSCYQPDAILSDFESLGVQAYRQFIKSDLLWDVVEPRDGEWHWEQADALIKNSGDIEPIATLFRLQYASPTPPWAGAGGFQKTLGTEARDYIEHVVDRYGPYVRYWELGNEMDHWRAADGDGGSQGSDKRPTAWPTDGFSPAEQGAFLSQAAAVIRERDPDAVIVLPGMGGLGDYTLDTWLAGVMEGGGMDFFDVVNYHFYSEWQKFEVQREGLTSFVEEHGIADKPVWLTETGATSSPTLTVRTNYPNSPESQAADIFRRIIPAYAAGDSLVIWHTYISSPDDPNNNWRLYGVLTAEGTAQPSYYAFRLLTGELLPFDKVERVEGETAHVYRITTRDGAVKYVAWGEGEVPVPSGPTTITSVIPGPDGTYAWQAVQAGQVITLSQNPVLLK